MLIYPNQYFFMKINHFGETFIGKDFSESDGLCCQNEREIKRERKSNHA